MKEDLLKYQSKSITPVDEYQCTLSDELKKMAEKELRETERIRNHAIKAIRDWVMENPRIIKCRLDSKRILMLLRWRKYSIPMTQEALERYLIFREGLYGYDWFSNLDPLRPNVLNLLEQGLLVPLPKRDKHGRVVFFIKGSVIDFKIKDIGSAILALVTLIMEILWEDEENQIRGASYIFDLSGIHLRQALIFPLDIWYKFGKNAEKACAIRHKAFHVFNCPQSLTYIANFAVKHMPSKLRDRVKFHTCDVAESDIFELDNLPEEFGGKIPLKTITDDWKRILLEKREYFLNYQNMKINRSMYPKSVLECTVDSLKKPLNELDIHKTNPIEILGVQGSFRKLEID